MSYKDWSTGYEFIRRALSMILTNKLADEYSFFKRKEKKSFCDLSIYKVIINKYIYNNSFLTNFYESVIFNVYFRMSY